VEYDLVLLVIAADEGIMPRAANISISGNLLRLSQDSSQSKGGSVEKDWLDLVEDEVRNFVKGTFLDGAPILPVHQKTCLTSFPERKDTGNLH